MKECKLYGVFVKFEIKFCFTATHMSVLLNLQIPLKFVDTVDLPSGNIREVLIKESSKNYYCNSATYHRNR